MQERLRRGIIGVYFKSLHEHLDEHMVKQVLGDVLRRAGPPLKGPAPDLDILSAVVLSRYAFQQNVCSSSAMCLLNVYHCVWWSGLDSLRVGPVVSCIGQITGSASSLVGRQADMLLVYLLPP